MDPLEVRCANSGLATGASLVTSRLLAHLVWDIRVALLSLTRSNLARILHEACQRQSAEWAANTANTQHVMLSAVSMNSGTYLG